MSTEEELSDSLIPEDAIIDFLYLLSSLREFEKNAEDWVRKLNEILKEKEKMKEDFPLPVTLIRQYISELIILSQKVTKEANKLISK